MAARNFHEILKDKQAKLAGEIGDHLNVKPTQNGYSDLSNGASGNPNVGSIKTQIQAARFEFTVLDFQATVPKSRVNLRSSYTPMRRSVRTRPELPEQLASDFAGAFRTLFELCEENDLAYPALDLNVFATKGSATIHTEDTFVFEIKRFYRQAALLIHPDHFQHSEIEATAQAEIFRNLKCAVDTLLQYSQNGIGEKRTRSAA